MKMRAVALLIVSLPLPGILSAARLKDLVDVEGVRDNQLIGYGLVVGLAGTGDRQQTIFSNQSLTNILERMGVAVSPTAIRVKNTAAVMVTATLPAFAQPGVHIDTTVAAIGDAANLQGGILVLTSLRGADGQVYAVAQGPVVTGGFVVRPGRNVANREPSYRRALSQWRDSGTRRSIRRSQNAGAAATAPVGLHDVGAHCRSRQREVRGRRQAFRAC